jgi:hypothetical protein
MIGIVFLLNLEYAPYIRKYTTELEKKGVDFEVICWDRLESDYIVPWKTISYKKRGGLNDSKVKKLSSFIGFRKFLIKTLNQRKYEKLIILTTLTGMLIGDYLIKNYRGKFIYDIRDYTFENNILYRIVESKIIKSANFTAISSEGFKNFLPENGNYFISHNIIKAEILSSAVFNRNMDLNVINISFIGAIRHYDIDKNMVDIFGNDSRFKVLFHGYGASFTALKEYCEGRFDNVLLTGKYDRQDKMNLLEGSNIINSYYSSDIYANKYAMPNKYYDALIYRIPLWANPNVYVGQRSIECGIGIDVKLDNDAPEKINRILKSFNWKKFEENCWQELHKISIEDEVFERKLNEFALL